MCPTTTLDDCGESHAVGIHAREKTDQWSGYRENGLLRAGLEQFGSAPVDDGIGKDRGWLYISGVTIALKAGAGNEPATTATVAPWLSSIRRASVHS